jgi:hypothetical protein
MKLSWVADTRSVENKLPEFIKPEIVLAYSQEPANGPYSEPVAFIPHPDTQFL